MIRRAVKAGVLRWCSSTRRSAAAYAGPLYGGRSSLRRGAGSLARLFAVNVMMDVIEQEFFVPVRYPVHFTTRCVRTSNPLLRDIITGGRAARNARSGR